MPNFRKGAEAIAKAQEDSRKNAGNFTPFAPQIFWKGDGAEHYLYFLNPLDEIPTVDLIGFIPQKRKKGDGSSFTFYEQTIARTDEGLDNPRSKDPMVEDWDAKPRATCVAVAVELEPTYEEVERGGRTRKRPVGFEVKTETFERRVRDDDGELTDEVEEVERPLVGFVTQSPHNFFNVIGSYDADTAPIHETALKITRVGDKNSTTYRVDGYDEQEVDLSGLVECIDGLSYLADEELDELLGQIEGQDDQEAALTIGAFLLDKRLVELADDERYDKLYESIDESLDKFGGSKKGKGKSERGERKRRERPTRRSQRRSSDDTPDEESEPVEEAPQPDASDEPEEAPKPRRGRRKAAEAAAPAEDTPKQEQPAARNRLDQLRERAAARAAKS